MLIASRRHMADDLRAWRRTEDAARFWASSKVHQKRVQKTRAEIMSFTGHGVCYAGTSWGKDSVCLAHLIVSLVPRVPLVWVRVEPDYNPDCVLVRDAFLGRFRDARYDEIVVTRGETYAPHGTLRAGMGVAAQRYGSRYLSGVRGAESGARARRMAVLGASTERTCAPLGWWTGADVFAYLVTRDLPIHPAYACTFGGLIDAERIRVGPLGGARGERPGDGMGRDEWERRYYGAELARLATHPPHPIHDHPPVDDGDPIRDPHDR